LIRIRNISQTFVVNPNISKDDEKMFKTILTNYSQSLSNKSESINEILNKSQDLVNKERKQDFIILKLLILDLFSKIVEKSEKNVVTDNSKNLSQEIIADIDKFKIEIRKLNNFI